VDLDVLLDHLQHDGGGAADLRAAIAALTSPAALLDVGEVLAELPADRVVPIGPGERPLRVWVTGTFTIDRVAPMVRAALAGAGIAAEVRGAGFDRFSFDLLDPQSPAVAFDPDVTLCVLHDDHFLGIDHTFVDPQELREVIAGRVADVRAAVSAYATRLPGTLVLHTVPLTGSEHRALRAHKRKAALGRVWRELNIALLELAEQHAQVQVLDLEMMQIDRGSRLRDERIYRFASLPWTPSVEALYAAEAARLCIATFGRPAKCLVLDLDNTLWGGVIGDDGPTAIQVGRAYPGNGHRDLQRRVKQLQAQGVLIAVASKNEQQVVREVFDRHPEFVLRWPDIVASAVGWEPKDQMLRSIADELNIGVDSLVFADDSPFECDLVRRSLPDVQVVHLAGNPAAFASRLLEPGFFDVPDATEVDRDRTRMYHAARERQAYSAATESPHDYLHGLGLRLSVRRADDYTLPRLVQLTQRTNQFNLVGSSYTAAEAERMSVSDRHRVYGFEVSDRFGTEGIVGGVWVGCGDDAWTIENMVMSCRVFSRGIERAVLQCVADAATQDGAAYLVGKFRPTGRNRPAARFYPDCGFRPVRTLDTTEVYELPLAPERPALQPVWITVTREM